MFLACSLYVPYMFDTFSIYLPLVPVRKSYLDLQLGNNDDACRSSIKDSGKFITDSGKSITDSGKFIKDRGKSVRPG